MTDNPLISEISALITEIRTPLIEKIGFKPAAIAYKGDRLEAADNKTLQMLVEWLKMFRDTELKKYLWARGLVSELTWQMYKLGGGGKPTYEQEEHKKAREALILKWKDRPHILTRKSDGEGEQQAKAESKARQANRKSRKANLSNGQGN